MFPLKRFPKGAGFYNLHFPINLKEFRFEKNAYPRF